MDLRVRQLAPSDITLMEGLLAAFAEAFNDPDAYGHRPNAEYLRQLLAGDTFIALAALNDGQVVGGIAAYELKSSSSRAARSTSTIWRSVRSIGDGASQPS